jgi:hypothetical protein
VALGEEIDVSEPDKIHRSNICLKPTPKTNQKIAPKRAQPSEKIILGGGEVDASTG